MVFLLVNVRTVHESKAPPPPSPHVPLGSAQGSFLNKVAIQGVFTYVQKCITLTKVHVSTSCSLSSFVNLVEKPTYFSAHDFRRAT